MATSATPGQGVAEHVLYLGWQAEAADALTVHGAEVTCVVTVEDAGAAREHGFAGGLVVVKDPTSAEEVLAGLFRAGVDPAGLSRVASEEEFALVTVGAIAATLGARSMSVPTALALRDKFVQKRLLREAGLRVARCAVAETLALCSATDIGFPLVVKPIAGGGARSTYALTSQDDLDRLTQETPAAEQNGPWLVEEFMAGVELHVDGVVREGEVIFLSVCRYLQNLIGIRDGGLVGSVVLPPAGHAPLYAAVERLTASALAALAHHEGVFHLEFFQQDESLVFSECAGRIGGGLIREMHAFSSGLDLYDEWARAVLGVPSGVRSRHPFSNASYGWVNLPVPAGRIEYLPGVDDLMEQPGVVLAQVSGKAGEPVPDLTSGSHIRVARLAAHGEDAEGADARLRELAAWFPTRARVATAEGITR
ncbi:ATP-grasp domain-containing protein [Streptomyces sp. NPDC058401]|uniref:ATP-grasp domain-containing protein n=1 Tax=Streptomyces sp. NPDC058401 TaxID=3346480 RepID=UPI00365BDDEA